MAHWHILYIPILLVAAALMTWALYRLRFFDIVPAVHDIVLQSITDGVFVLDLQGRVVDLNPAAQRMIGRAPRQVIGERIESVLPGYADAVAQELSYNDPPGKVPGEPDAWSGQPDAWSGQPDAWSGQPDAWSGDEPFRGEIVLWVWPDEADRSQRKQEVGAGIPAASQVQRHFEIQISSLYARRGRPSGQLVILHDVTERYRQSALYHVLHALVGQPDPGSVIKTALPSIARFAGWPDAIIALASQDGTRWSVQAAGGALQPVMGCEFPVEKGIVGRALRTGVTQLVPEGKASFDALSGEPDKALGCAVLHPAAESTLAVPLKIGDRVLGVLAITSQRLAAFGEDDVRLAESLADAIATTMDKARLFETTVNEQRRLLTLIESSRDGIILVGMQKSMLVVNAPALEMLGLPGEPKDWTERPLRDALDLLEGHAVAGAHAIRAEMKRIEVGDEPVGEGEFEVFPRSIHWLNLPVLADGRPLGRLLVLHDVTEERLLAKMREDLTHTMVHDLRNPLTGISTALQLLDSKLVQVITPAQHRLFEIATNSTQKMVDLVNSILDLSRLEKGKMPLNRAPLLLPDLFAETLRLQSPLYSAKRLQMESVASPTLPLAFADAELIERVLQNIVGNAIKFTPDGGTITIQAQEWAAEASSAQGAQDVPCSFLRVSVTDSGPGVPLELRDKLFEKFVVGEQQQRGSGLGLAFCKLAVQAHGGDIWIEGEPGQGATFVFTLPVFREGDVLETV